MKTTIEKSIAIETSLISGNDDYDFGREAFVGLLKSFEFRAAVFALASGS